MFGDIVVTYEKMQEVEFSFFTLPDSGAFLTHAPHRLSEALALVYPFQMEVWPALIFTIVITGPILYFMIIVPEWIDRRKRTRNLREKPKTFFNLIYIKEITKGFSNINSTAAEGGGECGFRMRINKKKKKKSNQEEDGRQLRTDDLFARCVWFTCHIFLRQCLYPFHNHVAPIYLQLLIFFHPFQ